MGFVVPWTSYNLHEVWRTWTKDRFYYIRGCKNVHFHVHLFSVQREHIAQWFYNEVVDAGVTPGPDEDFWRLVRICTPQDLAAPHETVQPTRLLTPSHWSYNHRSAQDYELGAAFCHLSFKGFFYLSERALLDYKIIASRSCWCLCPESRWKGRVLGRIWCFN